jgi:hypothetical protein
MFGGLLTSRQEKYAYEIMLMSLSVSTYHLLDPLTDFQEI